MTDVREYKLLGVMPLQGHTGKQTAFQEEQVISNTPPPAPPVTSYTSSCLKVPLLFESLSRPHPSMDYDLEL